MATRASKINASPWPLVVPLLFLVYCCSWAVCVSAKHHHHHQASASSPAPSSAAADCSTALLTLADCLTFVEEGSKEVKPKGQCCPGLKKVVKQQVSCLCQAFGADFGIKINMTKALQLPSACGVKTPPFNNCHIASGSPGPAPGLSPSAAPSISPSVRAAAPSPLQSAAASVPAPLLVLPIAAAVFFF